jgi:hypothetical protein
MSPTASSYERLDGILRGGEGDNIRSYDQDIASRQPSNIGLTLTSRSSRMTNVGPLIITTDREFRRAVTILRSDSYDLGTESWNRPRPISPNYGGLELTGATPGSFHMLLAAYGEVLSLLTSKPLQALITVFALGQGFGSIRFWRRRKKDVLAGMTARQALDVIKAYGGDSERLMQGDRPDLEIEIQQPEDDAEGEDELFTHPELTEDIPTVAVPTLATVRVSRSGEIVLRGSRITCILTHPDGTQSVAYIDGY